MNRDYIITLVLKARDEIAGAVAKALAEVEGLNKLAQKNGFKDLDADADRLSNTLRNKLGAALSEVRGNLNRTEADADKFERRYKSLGTTAEEVGRKFKRFDIDETGRKLRRAETDAKSAGDELEKLGRRTSKNGEEWDRLSGRLEKANSRINDHSRSLREAEKTADELMKVTGKLSKLEGEHEKAIQRTQAAYDKQIQSAAKLKIARDQLAMNPLERERVDFDAIDREIDHERRKAAELGSELKSLSRLHPTINIDVDEGGFDAKTSEIEAKKVALGRDVHVNVDMDIGGAEAKLLAFSAAKNRAASPPGGQTSLMGWFRDVGQEAEQNTHSIAAFDNALRGLAILTVVAMSQQLLTIMTALGAELIAVASSAILAGAAIGGALTAGIAQALPVVSLLVAAFARVGAVIEAIKQTESLKEQESYSGDKEEGKQLGADEAVVNATEAVIAAKQNLRLAEIGLTKARFEARRELQDLILAEKQAELAAKGAALSQFQAQMTLREAIVSGDVSGVAGAQLEVASSKLSSRQASINAGRAQQDLSLQERGSPLAPDQGIRDAERQVEQSVKALKQSERAAIAAKRAADEASTSSLAAAGKLNYMMGQLSESEKRLYKGARRLYQTYKEVMRPITDTIIDSFAYATNKGVELLRNPKFQSAFDSLAHSIAGNFRKVTDEFNSPKWIEFFSFMTKEAGRNLDPLTDAFLSVARAFRSIAEASAPILRDIVGWIKDGSEEFEDWVGHGKPLEEFFRDAEKHLESWLHLIGAVFELFGALIVTSADEGKSSVEGLTSKIEEATNWIESHRKEVKGFFSEVGEVMSVVGDVLLALGAEILKAFNVESVEDLGNVLIKVVIPALGDAVRLFGHIANVLSAIADNPAGAFMLKFLGSVIVLKAVLSPFVQLLKGAVIQVGKLAQMGVGLALSMSGVSASTIATHGAFSVLKARMAGYSAAQIGAAQAGVPLMTSLSGVAAAGTGVTLSMLAIPAAIAAVLAAFIYLSDQFGVLDDQWEAIKEVGEEFAEPIVESVGEVVDSFSELLKAFGVIGGESKGIGKVFEFVFVKMVKGGVIPTIKFFGSQLIFIGELIGGFFKGISGMIDILVGILTLDFDKIGEGAKKLFVAFTTPFRAMFNHVKRIVSAGIEVLRELFGGLPGWIFRRLKDLPGLVADGFRGFIGLFGRLGGRALKALTTGFNDVWDWIEDLPGKLFNAGRDVAKAFARGIGKLPDLVADAFRGATAFIGKLAGNIMEFINDRTPFGDDIDLGLVSIHLPNLPEHFQKGGPIGSGFGGGDRRLVLAEDGEHMLTKEEVRSAGGHGAIFSFRRSLGGGGQSRGSRFADGGAVKGGGQAGTSEASAAFGLEALLSMIINFGDEATAVWDGIWETIQRRTAGGANRVENRFLDLQKMMVSSSNRIENKVGKSFDSLYDTVRKNINELTQAVFKGMTYVVNATNEALKAFGAKPVDLKVPKPGGGGKGKAQAAATGGFIGLPRRAVGGWIGNAGERGADMIATWLGRGEAVLNWGQQKIVDPAMQAFYGFGLGDMFSRTKGEHAGGGAPGFSGGFAGQSPSGNTTVPIPGFPGEFIAAQVLDEALKMIKMFRLFVTDAFATAGHSGAGHLSTGTAMDVVPGAGGSWNLVDKAVAYARSKGMTVLYNGVEGHGRGHHAHIELEDGAITGAILAMLGGRDGKIDKVKVKGDKGSFMDIAQGALDKVQKAALKLVGEKSLMGHPAGVGYLSGGQGSVMSQLWRSLTRHGLDRIQAAGIIGNAYAESSLDPGAEGYGGGGLWGFTAEPNSLANLKEFAERMKKPWTDVGLQVQFLLRHVAASTLSNMDAAKSPEESARIFMEEFERPGIPRLDVREEWARRALQSFADGGVIGGHGGVGRQIPILAHLGEWILNPRQQMRLATMLGTSVDKLKGMLGFSGGPKSFAGGGEPKGDGKEEPGIARGKPVSALSLPNLENYNQALKFYLESVNKEIRRGVVGVNKKRKNLTDFIAKLFTRIAGRLEEFKAGWEILSAKLTTQLAKAAVRVKKGVVMGRQLQPDQLLNLEIKHLYKELDFLLAQQGPIVKSLRLAQKALKKAKKEGNTKAEQQAQAAIVKFKSMRRENEQAIAESQQEILEKLEQKMSEAISKVNAATERALAGSFSVDQKLAAFSNQEGTLNTVLGEARQAGNVELVQQIEAELEEIEAARVQAMNEGFERRLSRLATTASIQSAMGFSEASNATTAGQIPIWKEQKAMLESALGQAQSEGNATLAAQIEGEIQGLEVSIAEATAAMISNAVEAIETRAARAMFGIELGNRIADMRERYGDAPQRQEERGVLLHQESGIISAQMQETQALLGKAMAEGFGPDVIIPLQEKVQDLGVKLQENSAAIYSNTIAIRQAYIEQIQERQGFVGGIYGNLEQIVNSLGSLTGVVNSMKLAELMEAAGKQLGSTGWGLRGQLGAFVGERLSGSPFGGALNSLIGLKGEDLVAAVQELDFASIENFLGVGSEASKQFQALIQAILENEVAILQNTEQLKAIKQQNQIQSFTSTAWQWFRKAIFTGMGGLMPAYAEGTPFFAQAASGAEVLSDGPVEVHKGEIIIPPNFSAMLKRLVHAQAMAVSLGSGMMGSAPLSLDFASRRAAQVQAEMAGYGQTSLMAAELAALRQELASRTQENNFHFGDDDPTDDETYMANRIAFAIRTPST